VAALTQELKEAGNRDYTIKLFPNGNHGGLETSNVMLAEGKRGYGQPEDLSPYFPKGVTTSPAHVVACVHRARADGDTCWAWFPRIAGTHAA
jgi:hypothetical protein